MLFARAPSQAFKVGLYLKRGCLLAVSVAAVLNRSEPRRGEEVGRGEEAKTEEGKRTTLRRKGRERERKREEGKTMTAVQTRWTSNESRVFVKWKERVSTPLRLTGLSIRNASYPACPPP